MSTRLVNVEDELPTHSSAWRPRTHRVLQLTIFMSTHLHKGTESMPIISGLNGTRLGHGRCSSVGQRGRFAYERPSCSSTPCRWPAQLRRRRGRGGIRGALDWRGLRGRTSTSSHRRRPAGARGAGEAGERVAGAMGLKAEPVAVVADLFASEFGPLRLRCGGPCQICGLGSGGPPLLDADAAAGLRTRYM